MEDIVQAKDLHERLQVTHEDRLDGVLLAIHIELLPIEE
jgi:hypothetical protein